MFHFKQFSVNDQKSSMKVGTDAVLLGIEAGKYQSFRVLDVGTGCGLIALLIAQQSGAEIDAIDIDEDSCVEAKENFTLSPWSSRLKVFNMDFCQFSTECKTKYDLIVSNPPFFSSGERKKDIRLGRARHDESLDFNALISGVSRILSETGKLMCILPENRNSDLNSVASASGLFSKSVMMIRPVELRKPNRYIVTYSKLRPEQITISELTIRNIDLTYTQQFRDYVYEFYLDFPY